jgi:hypothetical protein
MTGFQPVNVDVLGLSRKPEPSMGIRSKPITNIMAKRGIILGDKTGN